MSFWNWFSVFKGGGSSGNIPSPRYDLNIDLNTITKSTVQNTNSMEPLLDVGHTALLVEPDNLQVGDVIVWKKELNSVIHSIVSIGSDEFGTYYTTQGINIPRPDPERIRKSEITHVCIGILFTEGEGHYRASTGD